MAMCPNFLPQTTLPTKTAQILEAEDRIGALVLFFIPLQVGYTHDNILSSLKQTDFGSVTLPKSSFVPLQ